MTSKTKNTPNTRRKKLAVAGAKRTADHVVEWIDRLTTGLASGTFTWDEVSRNLQTAELELKALRHYSRLALCGVRPERAALVARSLANYLSRLADEIDDPDVTTERKVALERRLARAQRGVRGANDEMFLRDALCETVQLVADNARKGPWKNAVPREPPERWQVLADEVVRIYGEALDMDRVPALRANVALIARAVEACSNVPGRGRRPKVSKPDALPRLCEALGFGDAEWDSIQVSLRRRRAKLRKENP